jgi:hypothetical protein
MSPSPKAVLEDMTSSGRDILLDDLLLFSYARLSIIKDQGHVLLFPSLVQRR